MDYKTIKEEIEKKFNLTKNQLDGVNNQARQLSEELIRLQGEYRLLEVLIKENECSNQDNKPNSENEK